MNNQAIKMGPRKGSELANYIFKIDNGVYQKNQDNRRNTWKIIAIAAGIAFVLLSFIPSAIPSALVTKINLEIPDNEHNLTYTNTPPEQTSTDFNFRSASTSNSDPIAILKISKTIVRVNESIIFDASNSYDPDGMIITHNLDFGDGTIYNSEKITYRYSGPGIYKVILTVYDNDYLFGFAQADITVVTTEEIPEIIDQVPDQIQAEDAAPWTLNLTHYKSIPKNRNVEFYFYLTGENTSLYTLVGENSTEDNLIFIPKPNAYGSDLVTLKLTSTENITVSQQFRINITSVNDPPSIKKLPDLIVHYDEPYIFDYEPYVNDVDTPRNKLMLSVDDGLEKEYIDDDGLKSRIKYPESMLGELVYATVTISDSEGFCKDVISIYISDNYAPIPVSPLPDITLYQGTIRYNAFYLDSYFSDPDNIEIFYSITPSHLDITLNPDHTVDVSANTQWSGSEVVTFRAYDNLGAFTELSTLLTVIDVNDPPNISPLPSLKIHYNYDYYFNLEPYIYDNDNSLDELNITISDPTHIKVDEKNRYSLIINYPVEYLNNSVQVILMAFDGLNTTFQYLNITITNNYPPELISQLPNIVFHEDMTLTNAFDLDNYFNDKDDKLIKYSIDNNLVNVTLNNDHTVNFSAPMNWFGMDSVCIRAIDSCGAFQETHITVTVLPVNDAPILLPIPPQFGEENKRWVLDLSDYVKDIDNDFSELEILVDDYNVAISGNILIFHGSPSTREFVEVRVRDGEFSASRLIEVQIQLAPRPQNPKPWDLISNIFWIIIIIELIILLTALIVQRKRNKYTVEEVFFIFEGGTLITHLTRHRQANVDDEIFSGMFTAVQDFIHDSFVMNDDNLGIRSTDNTWNLDELKLGDKKILIEHSINSYLAVIFSGKSSKRLRKVVNRLLEKIEQKYGIVLKKWNGNLDELYGTREILQVLMRPWDKSDKKTKSDAKRFGLLSDDIDDLTRTATSTMSIKGGITKNTDETEPYPYHSIKPSTPTTYSIEIHPTKDMLKSMKDQIKEIELNENRKPTMVVEHKTEQKQQAKAGKLSTEEKNLRSPMAIKIDLDRSWPITFEIKRAKKASSNESNNLNHSKQISREQLFGKSEKNLRSKNITITIDGKKVNVDPSQSLVKQLTKLDNED